MNFALTDEQRLLIEQVRELCINELQPYFASRQKSELEFDLWPLRLLGELNIVCPTIPKEYGGLGLDIITTALVIEEIAACWPGLAAVIDTNLHAVQPLLLAGSPEQKEKYLPLLTGPDAGLASFAFTETTGGSDIDAMQTCARKTKGGFIIDGGKDYVLNAPQANFLTLFAMTNQQNKKSSLRCFIIPRDTFGVKIDKYYDMTTLDYAQLAKLVFNEAFLDNDAIIKENELFSGYLLLSQTFDIGRVLVGATSVGIARAAYEIAKNYANERFQFGRPLKRHQAVAHDLVDMATKIQMARLMTWQACWLIDQGDDYTVASAMAKFSASQIAQEVTLKASDILASRAYERGSFIEQLSRDARVLSTIEGANNIQKNIIASLIL
ncbi:Acyl-CoA dehydrogenase/oxidase C-terminal [Syntrophomonas zehnderi OL-4]|uniref:Acyl-CoA dehydrogenase/oxidase C-terminal n=2 Tax=Syntrophomonas TaxID=862 RepID=A0A0E4C8L8_9FIRM|nr:Acyl-CoA dehydrogenase/oxidase C-terminal [Syntrophomonas zehnderi OL-4]